MEVKTKGFIMEFSGIITTVVHKDKCLGYLVKYMEVMNRALEENQLTTFDTVTKTSCNMTYLSILCVEIKSFLSLFFRKMMRKLCTTPMNKNATICQIAMNQVKNVTSKTVSVGSTNGEHKFVCIFCPNAKGITSPKTIKDITKAPTIIQSTTNLDDLNFECRGNMTTMSLATDNKVSKYGIIKL